MITAVEVYQEIASNVEKIANNEHAFVDMSVGDVVRQGDLYIIAINQIIKGGTPTTDRQLAPGSTQGSRHVVEGECQIFTVPHKNAIQVINRLVPITKKQILFVGPMITTTGDIRINHPEHADRTLRNEKAYLVFYQRTWADEVRRTKD